MLQIFNLGCHSNENNNHPQQCKLAFLFVTWGRAINLVHHIGGPIYNVSTVYVQYVQYVYLAFIRYIWSFS